MAIRIQHFKYYYQSNCAGPCIFHSSIAYDATFHLQLKLHLLQIKSYNLKSFQRVEGFLQRHCKLLHHVVNWITSVGVHERIQSVGAQSWRAKLPPRPTPSATHPLSPPSKPRAEQTREMGVVGGWEVGERVRGRLSVRWALRPWPWRTGR